MIREPIVSPATCIWASAMGYCREPIPYVSSSWPSSSSLSSAFICRFNDAIATILTALTLLKFENYRFETRTKWNPVENELRHDNKFPLQFGKLPNSLLCRHKNAVVSNWGTRPWSGRVLSWVNGMERKWFNLSALFSAIRFSVLGIWISVFERWGKVEWSFRWWNLRKAFSKTNKVLHDEKKIPGLICP